MLKRSLVIVVGWLILPVWVFAVDAFKISIAKWSFDDIVANHFVVSFDIGDDGLGLIASADSIQLNQTIGMLHAVKLVCKQIQLLSEQLICNQGEIAFRQKDLGQQNISFSIHAQPEKQQYKIRLNNIKLASGNFSGLLTMHNQHWQLGLSTAEMLLSNVKNKLIPYLEKEQQTALQDWEIDGKTALDLSIAGDDNVVKLFNLKLDTTAFNVSESSGKYVTEGIGLMLKLHAENKQKNWNWKSVLRFNQGQAYAEPVYLDFSQTPITFESQGIYRYNNASYVVNPFVLKQGDDIQLTGSVEGNFESIKSLNVEIEKTPVKSLYSTWIQPFVVGTILDNVELAGEIAVKARLKDQQYAITADLTHIYLHQASELFSIDDLSGKLGWTNEPSPVDFSLKWEGAYLYAIPIGKSELDAQVNTSTLTLRQPWQLPVLDGTLDIHQFELHYDKTEPLRWNFSAELAPVSMEKLSSTLGWPLLHGKLSGTIPDVRYQAHQITVGGALKVNLFGGNTIIRDLKLERPFDVLPQLQANVVLKDIDLKTLTQTFDFGEITGKLDGQINNLRLSDWRAVQFDATFATPKDDTSRHRISQQAVNNLSEIGGGAAGALQKSFLRFFENFSYKRLGLSCKLHNEVCEMSGVGEAKQGYYIVKGGGFPPRIDVVGYTRRVNWPDLIARLKAVSHSSGPVVR